MDINIEIREKQLASLEQFISSSKQGLNSILQTLNWSPQKLKDEETLVPCSLNPDHLVPPKSLDDHIKTCNLKMLKYNLQEDFLSEPTNDPKASIYIDNQKKLEIFSTLQTGSDTFGFGWNGQDPDPMTSDRLLSTYTPNQRLALYDFAKSKTTGPPILPEFNVTQISEDNKELSYEEILEQERNAKRRRIKYKTVHTSHKNHTEIIRDVIKNQMESYEEWIAEKVSRPVDRPMEQSFESVEAARSTTSNSSYSANSRDSRSRHSKESRKRRSSSQNYSEERSRYREERSREYRDGRYKEKHKMRSHEEYKQYRSSRSREFRGSPSLEMREERYREFSEESYKEEKYRDGRFVRSDKWNREERVDRNRFHKHS